jgi:hypothetical protein
MMMYKKSVQSYDGDIYKEGTPSDGEGAESLLMDEAILVKLTPYEALCCVLV